MEFCQASRRILRFASSKKCKIVLVLPCSARTHVNFLSSVQIVVDARNKTNEVIPVPLIIVKTCLTLVDYNLFR